MIEVRRPGWPHPIGKASSPDHDPRNPRQRGPIHYDRVELTGFLLSHAATIFLLQGASLRQLFTDVVLVRPPGFAREDHHYYSVVFAEPPMLWRPPPMISRVVLARLIERPVDMSPEDVLSELFSAEVA